MLRCLTAAEYRPPQYSFTVCRFQTVLFTRPFATVCPFGGWPRRGSATTSDLNRPSGARQSRGPMTPSAPRRLRGCVTVRASQPLLHDHRQVARVLAELTNEDGPSLVSDCSGSLRPDRSRRRPPAFRFLLAIASLPSRRSTSATTAPAEGVVFMHVLPGAAARARRRVGGARS